MGRLQNSADLRIGLCPRSGQWACLGTSRRSRSRAATADRARSQASAQHCIWQADRDARIERPVDLLNVDTTVLNRFDGVGDFQKLSHRPLRVGERTRCDRFHLMAAGNRLSKSPRNLRKCRHCYVTRSTSHGADLRCRHRRADGSDRDADVAALARRISP